MHAATLPNHFTQDRDEKFAYKALALESSAACLFALSPWRRGLAWMGISVAVFASKAEMRFRCDAVGPVDVSMISLPVVSPEERLQAAAQLSNERDARAHEQRVNSVTRYRDFPDEAAPENEVALYPGLAQYRESIGGV